jgi:hypothetical protein
MMRRVAIVLAILVGFVILNRGAWEGYFSDDDLDNLSWATVAGIDSFTRELATPVFSKSNTRPTGGLYYRWAGHAFEWNFGNYLIPLFALHWLNAGMVFLLLRRKGFGEWPALASVLFFLFHSALLEAWWKPMYIFDLLAGTFLLFTWLLFGSRYWWAGLATFWLAYKSKEVALFFPVVLALENWRQALPYFLVSLNFGLQALLVNRERNTVYTLRFHPSSLLTTVPFYFKQAVLNKFGALLLAPLAWYARHLDFARAAAGTLAMMVPLLFLPGRLFSVYLYVPLIVLTPGIAAIASRVPPRALAVGLAVLLGIDFQVLRTKRKTELAMAHEARAYMDQLRAAKAQLAPTAYFENVPLGYRLHGITGALRLVLHNPDARVLNPENEVDRRAATQRPLPTLSWFAPTKTLSIVPHQYGEAKSDHVDFKDPASGWQITTGWYDREGNFRWASRQARLRLLSTPEHKQLAIRFNNGPMAMQLAKSIHVAILLDGELIGERTFTTAGTPVETFALPRPKSGPVEVELRASPGFRVEGDDREFGIAVMTAELIR